MLLLPLKICVLNLFLLLLVQLEPSSSFLSQKTRQHVSCVHQKNTWTTGRNVDQMVVFSSNSNYAAAAAHDLLYQDQQAAMERRALQEEELLNTNNNNNKRMKELKAPKLKIPPLKSGTGFGRQGLETSLSPMERLAIEQVKIIQCVV